MVTDDCRICPRCGHANEVQAYDCHACTSSLDGTVPRARPQGVPAAPPPEDTLAAWAAGMEAAIAAAETRCHRCQAPDALKRYPFALASIEHRFSWSYIAGSAAASMLLAPLGMWVLAWKWKRRGLAFRMSLVLCPDCVFELENFHGLPPLDSYRLHPCYATLEEEGFVTFVPQAQLNKWAIIQRR